MNPTAHRVRAFSLHSTTSSSSSAGSDESRTTLLPTKEDFVEQHPSSPRLPSTLPDHRGRPPVSRLTRWLRLAPWLVVASSLLWMTNAWWSRTAEFKTDISYLRPQGEQMEAALVHEDSLPEDPMPVIVQDTEGNTRWTVSLPPSLDFPLRPDAYADLCGKVDAVQRHISPPKNGGMQMFPYYHVDENFMDVDEAESLSLLPSDLVAGPWAPPSGDTESLADQNGYCRKTLTFVLETNDAGLGITLTQLWLSYGLAKKEGRAFFIDDRHWAYGRYSTFFLPPPTPACLSPPDNRRLPCPRHANHLLVTAATQSRTFGHQFNEEFQDPHGVEVRRQNWIFGLMREGHDALFHLAAAGGDAGYAQRRIERYDAEVRTRGGVQVGIHIRHGDKHPWEYQYQKSYVPTAKYVSLAQRLVENAYSNETQREAMEASRMFVASDDPEAYNGPEIEHAFRAQERIILASKSQVDAADGKDRTVDDGTGWHGGFFRAMFWGLGDASHTALSPRERERQEPRVEPSELALRLRVLVGRAYLLDLAIVGQMDRIVCTVSSVGCRLLAVMMGWEEAIVKGHWRNVDGDFDWVGIRW